MILEVYIFGLTSPIAFNSNFVYYIQQINFVFLLVEQYGLWNIMRQGKI